MSLHEKLVVIDGHCDTALELVGSSYAEPDAAPRDFFSRATRGHVDLPRLREGGVTCQFMALFTDNEYLADAQGHTLRLLEKVESLFIRGSGFVKATRVADILGAKARGEVAGLLTIEGGEAIGGPANGSDSGTEAEAGIASLRDFHARGVRLMGLTWSRRNALGRGVGMPPCVPPARDGLTPFGRRVVGEMEALGMIVDASHLSDDALADLLDCARKPVVASHSNSRVLCPHPRNLTDEQALAIASTGGLVGITFAGLFVDPDPAKVNFEAYMEHLERFLDLLGPDHVAIGSDFDGWTEQFGVAMRDVSELPRITEALLARGYGEEIVGKVMGGNWLRVLGEVAG